MRSRWSEAEAARFVERYASWGEDLALRTYSSRLLGGEPGLVLHGGGNTSLKGSVRDLFGEEVPALFVKASGRDLAAVEPGDHAAVALAPLRRLVTDLAAGAELDDAALERELRRHLLDPGGATPSIEAPVHAVVPARFVDHTHADAILALSNREDGERAVEEALSGADGEVLVVPYATPGHPLARAVAAALAARGGLAGLAGMVWERHGLLTWGETARESYERTLDLVSRAERALARGAGSGRVVVTRSLPEPAVLRGRLERTAPLLRGLLAGPSDDPDRPFRRVLLRALQEPDVVGFLATEGARELALAAPLTADHLIRTGAFPLWVDEPPWDDPPRLREVLAAAVEAYTQEYTRYFERHRGRLAGAEGAPPPPDGPLEGGAPRVLLLPGLGALGAGRDAREAQIACDITAHTLRAKAAVVAAGGVYRGLSEEHLFDMEHRPLQLAKLRRGGEPQLARTVALVTGAAGAIGAGVARGLLEAGAHVVVTDLPGDPLEALASELEAGFPGRVQGVPLDVTDEASVAGAFAAAGRAWGGVDLVVANAGLAHVAALEEMDLEAFHRLERVNVDGTLLVLRAAAGCFRLQGTGGDVVVVSTKNVFAPGARFGAYSATKAAAHQLARIASLEMAGLGVRVNLVAPDAVFGEGRWRSGLWAEVGPDRMRARGLDPEGLEAYYRERNLLRVRVTARHVAAAVVFFACRATPTTGATLPVDGGLPDATPR